MTDRPEKWKGLERIAAVMFAAQGRVEMRSELAREFGPLLDAADAVRKSQVRGRSITLDSDMDALTQQLEKFR